MSNKQIVDLLNVIGKEISPDPDFEIVQNLEKPKEFWGWTHIGCPTIIYLQEVLANKSNGMAMRNLMKCKIQDAYRDIIDFAQEQLEKIE